MATFAHFMAGLLGEGSGDTPDSDKVCLVCGETGLNIKRCSRCKNADYCSKECQRKDWKRHKPLCRPRADAPWGIPWEDISSQFHLRDVVMIDNLEYVPDEYNPWSSYHRQILVAKIVTDALPAFFRHKIVIEDAEGNQRPVMFYVDYDVPMPFFHWFQLRVGRIIAILDPVIHRFLDGQIGIRIDEASDIRVFERRF